MTKPLTSMEGIGIVDPQLLTRSQRLERWALALERLRDTPLRTLRETEHQHRYERLLMREDNSPLTVAFEEPVLRSAGLKDDTFGEVKRFFELSDWDLHNILCYCHFGPTVRASETAARVRSVQARAETSRASNWIYGMAVGTLAGGTALLLSLAI